MWVIPYISQAVFSVVRTIDISYFAQECKVQEAFKTLRWRQNDHHFDADIFIFIILYFDSYFTKLCSQGSKWQQVYIDLDEIIVWINDGPV